MEHFLTGNYPPRPPFNPPILPSVASQLAPSFVLNQPPSAVRQANSSDLSPDNKDVINGIYRKIHQKLNMLQEWETFELSQPQNDKKLAFLVYFRHNRSRDPVALEILVEIHSETLKRSLRDCVDHLGSLLDETPMIDARKLYTQSHALSRKLEDLKRQSLDTEAKVSCIQQDGGDPFEDAKGDNHSAEKLRSPLDKDSGNDDSRGSFSEEDGFNNDTQCLHRTSMGSARNEITNIHLSQEILQLQELISFLKGQFDTVKLKLDTLLNQKKITFDLLWLYFPIGSEILFDDQNTNLDCAGTV